MSAAVYDRTADIICFFSPKNVKTRFSKSTIVAQNVSKVLQAS